MPTPCVLAPRARIGGITLVTVVRCAVLTYWPSVVLLSVLKQQQSLRIEWELKGRVFRCRHAGHIHECER